MFTNRTGVTAARAFAGGIFGAFDGIISGPLGAAIMDTSNHAGYNAKEALFIGLLGDPIVFAAAVAALSLCGFFDKDEKDESYPEISGYLGFIILNSVLGAVIAHEIINPIMGLSETAISFCVGNLVAIPCCYLIYYAFQMVLDGYYACNREINRQYLRESMHHDLPAYGSVHNTEPAEETTISLGK